MDSPNTGARRRARNRHGRGARGALLPASLRAARRPLQEFSEIAGRALGALPAHVTERLEGVDVLSLDTPTTEALMPGDDARAPLLGTAQSAAAQAKTAQTRGTGAGADGAGGDGAGGGGAAAGLVGPAPALRDRVLLYRWPILLEAKREKRPVGDVVADVIALQLAVLWGSRPEDVDPRFGQPR
ncbi:hypothetical protein [Falsarthrobacter nasiphocae]|uniref:Zn-dependent protease with MMP-like domain n=1 Tax=Falsarthrobacter nasiphocae TaxID=189863 RepID=A0AAE4C7P2_9MICC|nr:hypothetical protein [Falsarthrobacter nasiphocae]MDR6891625.1 putative Zn-dependent protease with MMP-like domain [Falsarthrobacter nasiphocae]